MSEQIDNNSFYKQLFTIPSYLFIIHAPETSVSEFYIHIPLTDFISKHSHHRNCCINHKQKTGQLDKWEEVQELPDGTHEDKEWEEVLEVDPGKVFIYIFVFPLSHQEFVLHCK